MQDEWKLTDTLTLNLGLRFDQLYQFVDANQFSPRAALVYKPVDGTTSMPATPAISRRRCRRRRPSRTSRLFTNTTNQPEVPFNDPVLPERSHYFDIGVDQRDLPGLDVGLDTYYKIATGHDRRRTVRPSGGADPVQLGARIQRRRGIQGQVSERQFQSLCQFRLQRHGGDRSRYRTSISSMPTTYTYLLTHYHYTDDMQLMTGSAGASYRWDKTLFTADMIYGSGLRSGFANIDHNHALCDGQSRHFAGIPGGAGRQADHGAVRHRQLVRKIYELRDGSGIGVFAPQFGARRRYYAGLSQKLLMRSVGASIPLSIVALGEVWSQFSA